MRAVNLLPQDLDRQGGDSDGRIPLFVAAGGIAAVTAFAAVLFVSASGSVSDQRSRLDSVKADIARVPSSAEPAVASGTIAQERSDRVAALTAALATRVPLDRLLRELAYVLPEDAWLTGLSASAPETNGAAGASPGTSVPASTGTQGVTIQGATYTNRSVARVLARLAAIPSLDSVRLGTTTRVEPAAPTSDVKSAKSKAKKKKQRPIVTFTIAANIRAGSGS
jgi:Tfp pilus assembly protein PilN